VTIPFVTPGEAEKRSCPIATGAFMPRGEGGSLAAVSRTPAGFPHPATACLGPRCMAWRWREQTDSAPGFRRALHQYAGDEPAERPADVPPSWRWRPFGVGVGPAGWQEPADERAAPQGYCGLVS
jgi:hypothetical protein